MIQQVVTIEKGSKQSEDVHVKSRQLKYIGVPLDKRTLENELDSEYLSFEVSFDGEEWHTLIYYSGRKLSIRTRATQEVKPPESMPGYSYAMIPVKDPELFYGMMFLRLIGDKTETETRAILLYLV